MAAPRHGHRSAYLLPLALCLLFSGIALSSLAQSTNSDDAFLPLVENQAPAIVAGFIGGPIHHNVPLYDRFADRLQEEYGDEIRVQTVYNGVGDRKNVDRNLHNWLDTNGDGQLSETEKRGARIVLFGHSFGGAAAIAFARDLQKENIPVALTVQIDSIPKPWQQDDTIPANVAHAINFYQTHGILHGQSNIVAADPARTQILGNVFFSPDPKAAPCRDYPLFYRIFSRDHIIVACDPEVWSQIDALIKVYLFSPPADVPQSKDID